MSAETREAGRTLDAEIAEKVMGWVVNRRDGGHWNTVGSYHPRLIIGSYNCCEGWSPSTEIAAAWEVVEKMADAGKVFIVKADGLRDGTFNPRYTVFCDNHPVVHARTAPLAICLSALRAATPGGADGA